MKISGTVKVKRGPGRPWGSYSKNKLGSNSGKKRSFISVSRKVVINNHNKPHGRWHINKPKKVCLLCLCQYSEDSITSDNSSEEEDEEDDDCDAKLFSGLGGHKDPLSENSPKNAEGHNDNALKNLTHEVVKIPKKKKLSLYLRFLTILNRHAQVKTKKFKSAAIRNDLANPFCPTCKRIAVHMVQVYDQLQVAKLGLKWRLRQISDLIRISKTNVSGKLHITLQKSLSTQLRVVSARSVDVLRKQISIRCSAKSTANQVPAVSLNKNACVNAVKANWKWQYAYEQMKCYLQSLIVVFSLAVPPKDPPEKKAVPIAGPKSKTKKVWFGDEARRKIKVEVGSGSIEAKKENVPPRVKREPGSAAGQEGEECGSPVGDDDHFGGGDYSPPGSGPSSPVGQDNDEGENEDEANKNGDDSDWSANGAASGNDSDVEFTVSANTTRRWNLRRRCTRSKSKNGDKDDNDSDTEYVPGNLPPLRSSKKRLDIPESEKPFACNLCSQRFRMDRGLKRHLSQFHGFLMQYNCPKCPNLRFTRKKDLEIHRKKAHRPANWKMGDSLPYMGHPTTCTHCDQVFPSKMKMIIHRRTTHKLNATIHTCETCGKKVRGERRMEFHKKTHSRPDKPHRCNKCPRSFGTEEGLKVHLRIHAENPEWVPWIRDKKRKSPINPREGVFKCDIPNCHKIFYKSSNLTIHKSLHDTVFKCTACEVVTSLPRDFRKHLMEMHENEQKNYHCLYCDKAFTLEQTYDLHQKIAHPTKTSLSCDVDFCEELFDNTEQLRQHLKTMHLPPDVEETKVDVKFTDIYGKTGEIKKNPAKEEPKEDKINSSASTSEPAPRESLPTSVSKEEGEQSNVKPEGDGGENQFADLLLLQPKASDSETKRDHGIAGIPTNDKPTLYTCARCDWSFSKQLHFSLHLILHTPRNDQRLYPCELCDKAYSMVDSLQTHMNRIHGPRIKPYLCLICGVRFHRKESFIPHMRIHKDKEATASCDPSTGIFKCETCKKVFQDSVNLAKHLRMAHQPERFIKKCDVCEEVFPNKTALLNHKVEKHGMEKPFKCTAEGCSKGYFTPNALSDHMICHSEAKFPCTLCDKKFKRRHNLDDHYMVHRQEKNHFCEYCGRAFVKKSSLNLHLDIHKGIKKYKCDHCDKAFCRKYARDCHLRTHTGERPFKCDICTQDFSQYSSLKCHLRAHEKVNNDKVKRVPFRKSIGVGRPLKKKKNDGATEEAAKGETGEAGTTNQDKKADGPTTAGILHEAMNAAFGTINMVDLEGDDGGLMKQDANAGFTAGISVIDVANAVTAVATLEHSEPKEEDESEEEEEEREEVPLKKKRGRKPKLKAAKNFSCGFCGKTFQRENFYNMHVERHMKEVEAETIHSGGDASQQSHHSSMSLADDHSQPHQIIQPVFQHEPQPLMRSNSISFEQPHQQPIMNTPTTQQHQLPSTSTAVSQPLLQQPKKRGRPPKQNSAPGSRLARIVEDVLEAATSRPGSVVAHQQYQQQYSHPQQQQLNIPQPQSHHAAQSPHNMGHSGSERSTPASSPAPAQQHHQPQQQAVVTTATPSLPFTSSSASFLSPFLFTNPYLIPRAPDQQQQDPMFVNFPHRQQQQQNPFPGQALPVHQQPQQSIVSVSYPQQQFHQSHIHSPSPPQTAQGSPRTMPQDLSKNNFSIFYHSNNQR